MQQTNDSTLETLRTLGRDLYDYAFPIVLMDITMKTATNVESAGRRAMHAPVNQFCHFRESPKANAKDVVRFNFDTLYSFVWLDVRDEPMVLSVPDTDGRYYLIPALDMWTDVFAVPGSRTTGTQAQNFLFVPPGWSGRVPAGMHLIVVPTHLVLLIGRIQTNGPEDYPNVHRIQDGFRLTPLSIWGSNIPKQRMGKVDPKIDMKTPPQIQVLSLDGITMLQRLAELMKEYPPHFNDYPILFRAEAIGLMPGKSWNPSLEKDEIEALQAGAQEAKEDLLKSVRNMGVQINGWSFQFENIGTYGTSYRKRALVALAGLGANLPEDAIYPGTYFDSDGKLLDGENRYRLHFDAGETPPCDAFWSITVYDEQGFQVPNRLNRFAIGDRDPLRFNQDGSLDLWIQADSPGSGRETNWLPVPKSQSFNLTMRIYSPRREVQEGHWAPPSVERLM